jgi:hypothetical protein
VTRIYLSKTNPKTRRHVHAQRPPRQRLRSNAIVFTNLKVKRAFRSLRHIRSLGVSRHVERRCRIPGRQQGVSGGTRWSRFSPCLAIRRAFRVGRDRLTGRSSPPRVLVWSPRLFRLRHNVDCVTSRRWWGSPSRSSSRHAMGGS